MLISELATWLRDEARDPKVPGGIVVAGEFGKFRVDLPARRHYLRHAQRTQRLDDILQRMIPRRLTLARRAG